MLINTDIQLALAQLGVIMELDKQLRDVLDEATKKRMIAQPQPVVELLNYIKEAETHLINILGEKHSSEMYVIEKGRRIGIGEAYERYIKH